MFNYNTNWDPKAKQKLRFDCSIVLCHMNRKNEIPLDHQTPGSTLHSSINSSPILPLALEVGTPDTWGGCQSPYHRIIALNKLLIGILFLSFFFPNNNLKTQSYNLNLVPDPIRLFWSRTVGIQKSLWTWTNPSWADYFSIHNAQNQDPGSNNITIQNTSHGSKCQN